jgi:hypothetical protein
MFGLAVIVQAHESSPRVAFFKVYDFRFGLVWVDAGK